MLLILILFAWLSLSLVLAGLWCVAAVRRGSRRPPHRETRLLLVPLLGTLPRTDRRLDA